MKKKVLVHVCCAPCSSYCLEKLIDDGYKVVGYFYNPNIHPDTEYEQRKAELHKLDHEIIPGEDPPKVWHEAIKGLENEKEGGARCEVCFRLRLEKTAKHAKQNEYDAFTTVLTVSPHKNSEIINRIGRALSEKYGVEFIEENFKKNNGFKRTMQIAREKGFYKQKYCGCAYSSKPE